MIIDTSAMVAILYGEPEAAAFTRLIHDSAASRISVRQSAMCSASCGWKHW